MTDTTLSRNASGFILGWVSFVAVLTTSLFLLFGIGPDGTSIALRVTARVSFIFFALAFIARPLDLLWSTRFSDYLRNRRRELGIVFGLSMLVHLFCISWLYYLHFPLWPPVIIIEDVYIGGFGLFLAFALTLTSFELLRRRMTPRGWRVLHRTGIYFVWAVFFFCLVSSMGRKDPALPELTYHPFLAVLVLIMLVRFAAYVRLLGAGR